MRITVMTVNFHDDSARWLKMYMNKSHKVGYGLVPFYKGGGSLPVYTNYTLSLDVIASPVSLYSFRPRL